MHQYQERDGTEDRKPVGKTRVKEIMWHGGRIGQNKVEEWYSVPFRRPQMIGKARAEDAGEEEELYHHKHYQTYAYYIGTEAGSRAVACV